MYRCGAPRETAAGQALVDSQQLLLRIGFTLHCLSHTPSLYHSPTLFMHPSQIENPVRVLPMARFCVGNRTAALSMVKHFPDVQHAIKNGLMAAAAAEGPEGPEPPAVPPPDAMQRMRQSQSGYGLKHLQRPNGQAASLPPLAAPPATAMSRR